MWDLAAIQTIGIMIAFTGLMVLMFQRTRVPHIVIYIVSGLLLGQFIIPGIPAQVGDVEEAVVDIISEIGIALLLFLVGLELSLKKIRDVGKISVLAGIGQVVFTAIFGTAIAMLLQFSLTESLVLGTALTFSSTVVVVKLLTQKNQLNWLYGRISVGIFLVQDLIVIVVLTVMAGIFEGGDLKPEGIALGLTKAVLGMSVMLVLTLLLAKWILAKLLIWAADSTETILIWSLFWCFFLVVTAEAFGLSPEIGAFLAGLGLAQLPLSSALKQRVHPLMNFFIAIFFISLGLRMDVSTAIDNWWPGLVLSLFVLIGNPIIFLWIIARGGFSERTSFLAGVTVAQISEFSFIFAALCLQSGLIGQSAFSVVTLVGLVTIVVSSYMIMHNEKLYLFASRFGLLAPSRARREDKDDTPPKRMKDHYIVVGMNDLGHAIVRRLHSQGSQVLAIDTDVKKMEELPCGFVIGSVDYLATLKEANYHEASLVISALRIEETNNSIVYHCKQANVPVAVHGFDSSVIPELRRLGADYIIDSKKSWLRTVCQHLRAHGIVPE